MKINFDNQQIINTDLVERVAKSTRKKGLGPEPKLPHLLQFFMASGKAEVFEFASEKKRDEVFEWVDLIVNSNCHRVWTQDPKAFEDKHAKQVKAAVSAHSASKEKAPEPPTPPTRPATRMIRDGDLKR